jgi:hypothetical protein
LENFVEDRNDTLEAHLERIEGKIDSIKNDLAQLRSEMRDGFQVAYKKATKLDPKLLWGGISVCAFLVLALGTGTAN